MSSDKKYLQYLYGEAFYNAQIDGSFKSARIFVEHLSKLGSFSSVVDIGCGRGTWLAAFLESGASRAVGIDGHWNKADDMLDKRVEFYPADLNASFPVDGGFDVAISLEVAEHLLPEVSCSFVERISCLADLVMFSAAYKGQPGTNHINTRPHSFWAEEFRKCGFLVFDYFRPRFWGDASIEPWYAQNTFLYVRPTHWALKKLVELGVQPMSNLTFCDCIHPWLYNHWRNRAKGHETTQDIELVSLWSDSDDVLEAVIDSLGVDSVGGLVVLKPNVILNHKLIVSDITKDYLVTWGIESPKYAKLHQDNPNALRARFKCKGIRVEPQKSLEICLVDTAGNRQALWKLFVCN